MQKSAGLGGGGGGVSLLFCEVIIVHNHFFHRDSGIEIPEAWMPTIKKHNNRRATKKQATEGAANRNSED